MSPRPFLHSSERIEVIGRAAEVLLEVSMDQADGDECRI